MNFLRTTATNAQPVNFLLLLWLFLAGCISPTPPSIQSPVVVKPPPPVVPGAQVSVRVDVNASEAVYYQWRADEGGGEIIRGDTSSAAVWQAPEIAGTYNVYVQVTVGEITYPEKSLPIEVVAITATFTPTPTYTSTPTHTSTPSSTPTYTVTPIPTNTRTPTTTPSPCLAVTSSLSPLFASETVMTAIHTDQAPKIDGCLDEEIWAQAQPLTYALHPAANDSTTATVRLLWDDKYLYAGFDVSDTQVEDSSIFDNVWDGDSVGVIIENGGKVQEYRYTMRGDEKERSTLVGDRAGTKDSRAYFIGATSLNNPHNQDEGYTVEMRIPWATLPTPGGTVPADLWSIDHDYNPGIRYDDPDTVFSKISWDGDQSVDTAGKNILLSSTPPSTSPSPITTPVPSPTEFNSGKVIDLGIYTFTSGVGPGQETGRQEILIGKLESGQYTLILQNALAEYSGHWLVWDYLALRTGSLGHSGEIIWAIGSSDAPPDYSENASNEFCDPFQRNDCLTEFTVGVTLAGDLVRELNDGRFPTEKIHFEITDQQANNDFTLILSTLYSTHKDGDNDIENFKMQISLAGMSSPAPDELQSSDPCFQAKITSPQGTHNEKDAAAFLVSSPVIVSWEPADCVMIVQYYQNDAVQMDYGPVKSGTNLNLDASDSGKTEIKLWREGFTEQSDHIWVWVK